jgi:hypothetical protein
LVTAKTGQERAEIVAIEVVTVVSVGVMTVVGVNLTTARVLKTEARA